MEQELFNTYTILDNVKIDGGLRKKNIFKKSFKDNPLITIITVVYNNEKFLEESIQSLHKQNYNNYEHIIIDGGSTDGTLDIIKKYESKVDYWCSEKDKGIYDAFNKGMQLAKGEYLGFLNSDDCFSNNTLEILNRYIKKNPKIDFFFGAVKKHWGILHGYKKWKINFTWGFYSSHSTGFFIKKDASKIVGKYNLKYKYSSDYDYFFRMIVKHKLKGIGTKKNELFGTFQRGGFSSNVDFFDHFVECTRIRLDNKQNKIMVLITIIIKYIFNLKKF